MSKTGNCCYKEQAGRNVRVPNVTKFEASVSMFECTLYTFSSLSGRGSCLADVLFLSREDLNSCKATLAKSIKLAVHITRDEFVSEAEYNKIRQELET